MAYDRDRHDRDRYDRDRGMLGRAADEVRSWMGDDEARRRREREEREERYGERERAGERWRGGAYGEERNYRDERPLGRDDSANRSLRSDPYSAWNDESMRSEGYRDYGDRWGRSYSNTMDRDRDRERYSSGFGGGSASQAYARGSQEFGPEGYGSPRAYESSRTWGRDMRSQESWRVPGPHAGRGPKGYQRSDERIREEINDRLTAHGLIDATDVEVRTQNGEVTLTGYVDSREAKRAAEECAEDVPGVREVHNHLRLRTNAPDAEGVGRTNVLGLSEQQTQTASTSRDADASRSRARNI